MIQIKPTQIVDEKNLATQLSVFSSEDNLSTNCSFIWMLYDEKGEYVNNGVIECTGTDYASLNGDNKFPYNFVCNKLSLTPIN